MIAAQDSGRVRDICCGKVSRIARQNWFVHVVTFGLTGIDTLPDIADVAQRKGHLLGDDLLQRQIELVNLGQQQSVGAHVVADTVHNRNQTIRRNRCGCWTGRQRGKGISSCCRVRAAYVLRCERWNVVRKRGSKNGPEEADIVIHLADGAANHRSFMHLVRETEATAQVQKVYVLVAVRAHTTKTQRRESRRLSGQ